MNNWYVYRHRKKTNLEVFYIGIGKVKNRYKSKANRNIYWKNTVNKHGFIYEKIAINLSKENAWELEIFLIEEYGRSCLGKGSLVNITKGGEGTTERRKGKNHHNYKKVWTEESKRKNSLSQKGIPKSEETKEKIRISKIGVKHPKSILLLNTKTGIFYESVIDAANSIGFTYGKLRAQLNGQNINRTDLIRV